MAEVAVGNPQDISAIVSQITPLITTVMNLAIMFFMLKFIFQMLERVGAP